MLSTILVPLDGSALAEQALPVATRLARAAKASLVLTRVLGAFSIPETALDASASGAATAYLERIAADVRSQDVATHVAVRHGDTPAQIVSAVEAHSAGVVVMSTHGRSGIGRWLYGSVADAVMRLAPVPVLLVPPGLDHALPSDHPALILVPLDGSRASEAILAPVQDLAAHLGGELLLLNVVSWPPILYTDPMEVLPYPPGEEVGAMNAYLEQVAGPLRASGVTVRCLVDASTMPAMTIARVAQDAHVDLVAMATHGRSGLARVVLGSTTTITLQHARVPVLVVRPTGVQVVDSAVPEPKPALVPA